MLGVETNEGPVLLEVWDWDLMSEDDFMGTKQAQQSLTPNGKMPDAGMLDAECEDARCQMRGC